MAAERCEEAGWRFGCRSSHICGNPGLLALARHLADPYVTQPHPPIHPFCVHGATRSLKPCMCGSALVMGVNMHLPDAVFDGNYVTITHLASGFTLRFDAKSALLCWARDSVEHGSRELRVPPAAAPAWRERMAAARQRSSVDVDWTFRCDSYAPDGEVTPPQDSTETAFNGSTPPPCLAAGCAAVTMLPRRDGAPPPVAGGTSLISLKLPSAREVRGKPVEWTPHEGVGLAPEGRAGKIARQQDPILWSCDIPLYFDGMHDHGETELRVRVRVTSKCFLVLMRHHLVINGVMIAHKEVRYFHAFGDQHILRMQSRASMSVRSGGIGRMQRLITEQQAAMMLSEAAAHAQSDHDRPIVSAQELDLNVLTSCSTAPTPPIPATPPPRKLSSTPLLPTPLDAHVSALSLSADGGMLAVGDCNGSIVVIALHGGADTLESHNLLHVQGHSGSVTALGFSRVDDASPALLSCGEDGKCKLWSLASRAEAATPYGEAVALSEWDLECQTADRAYTLGPEGKKVATSIVQLLACEPTEEQRTARFSVAVGASVVLLDCHDTGYSRRLRALAAVTALEYLVLHRHLCASGYGGVSVWSDFGRGAALVVLPFKGPLDSMSVPLDERYVACGAQDGTLVMWPVPSKELLAPAPDQRAEAGGIPAAAPVSSQEQEQALHALLSRSSNGKELGMLKGLGIQALQASEEDEAVAAQKSGAALFFSGGAFEHKVGPVAWDHTSRLCASAGGRWPVVWEMGAAGTPPPVRRNGRAARLLGFNSSVSSLAFAPRSTQVGKSDGQGMAVLASASVDGHVALHEVPVAREPPNGAEDLPGTTFSPSAISAIDTTDGRTYPSLIWGDGLSAGWLFCGAGRGVNAFKV